MVFSKDLPSPATMFSTYASLAGYIMMIKPMIHTIIPRPIQNFVFSYIKSFVGSCSSTLTLVINDMINGTDRNGMPRKNELFFSAQAYLSSKISPDASKLRMTRDPNNKNVNLHLSQGVKERLSPINKTTTVVGEETEEAIVNWQCFELSFDKKHKDLVVKSYIAYVERKAKVIKEERRIIKMHSYSSYTLRWQSVKFEHPSTFHTMAMTPKLKSSVMEDLDRFIKRKDYYKRVGKARKRGYFLYGPPGTGKSSLLANVQGDAQLRSLLLATNNTSILLVEDIDCSVDLPTRLQPATTTLGINTIDIIRTLNCIDGLWSSCGDERIVIFTTNNKEVLDPAFLRPGRMDMHIYLGHCSFEGFKTLASNYLGMPHDNDDPHRLYPDIKRLIDGQVLTPAQVAEELMKNEDADMALEGLVKVLKRKRSESENSDDESKKMKMLQEGDKRISNSTEET
ncbi:putative AAA+ ATPase domain, ATPase, AAA-type, AAA-type ATPase domain-containing protein [Arabidopsis thaliana]